MHSEGRRLFAMHKCRAFGLDCSMALENNGIN
jgi:hypothetical protein